MTDNDAREDVSDSQEQAGAAEAAAPPDPVRKWTKIVLVASVVLMIWYLISDRITPYTTQARVHALVVPIAPEVSGTVVDVAVGNNQFVDASDLLLQIEKDRYQLTVDTAQANLQSARQATGASSANVTAAEAGLASAKASEVRSRQDAERMRRIKEEDPGAISTRRIQSAEATLTVSVSQVAAAEANLEKARQDLGDVGEDNVRILEAQAALEQAEINLKRTTVLAPANGYVTDVRVDRGNFAAAGAPLMTFVAGHNIWVQADFTENNLGHVRPGSTVEIIFDSMPGRVFSGSIRGTGFGVAVDSAPLGSLPTIENNREWLRDAQRFSTVVDFEIKDRDDVRHLRVGAQASVIVYATGNWLFNAVAKFRIRIASMLSYVF